MNIYTSIENRWRNQLSNKLAQEEEKTELTAAELPFQPFYSYLYYVIMFFYYI